MFFGDRDGSDSLRKPGLKPTSYTLGLNFTTPCSLLNLFRKSNTENERGYGEGEPHEDVSSHPEPEVESSQLEIHAMIEGNLQHPVQLFTFVNEDTGEEETQQV